ncbi:MAG: TolC family protein, partial [Kofleriaceae bacterium]
MSLSAGYTRNQDETIVTIPRTGEAPVVATIVPLDQLDAQAQVTVPLFDLGARRTIRAADAEVAAARADVASGARVVEEAVVHAYYRWVAGHALVRAGEASAAAAAEVSADARRRVAAGLALALEVAQAAAQEARARRAVADARLVIADAERELTTLTGAAPAGPPPELGEGTAPEAPLASWLDGAPVAAEVTAARARRDALAARRAAARARWAPVVSGFARERLSNGAGFGQSAQWSLGVSLSWQLDRGTAAAVDVAGASEAVAAAR